MQNVRPRFTLYCFWLGVLAVALVPLSVNAQSAKYEVFTLPGGTPVMGAYTGVAGTANRAAGQAIWNSAVALDGGLPIAAGSAAMRTATGEAVAIAATSRIPAATVGAAVGRLLLKVAGPLTVGIALYDLAKELGFTLNNSSGTVVATKPDPNACISGTCYKYGGANDTGAAINLSLNAACSKAIAERQATYPSGYSISSTGPGVGQGPNASCPAYITRPSYDGASGPANLGVSWREVAPDTNATTTASQQELLDAVAAKSGWPSSSAVGRLLQDDIKVNPDAQRPVNPLSVTGPATTTGPVKNVSNANNTTTRTTTNYNHTYNGDTITTNQTTTVINIDNSTGAQTTISTENGPADTPPPDACKDNPDSAGCAKLGDIPQTETLPDTPQAVNVTTVAFAGGSCPPPISFNVIGHSYAFSYTEMCARLAVLKWLFLAMAGVIAALILADTLKV